MTAKGIRIAYLVHTFDVGGLERVAAHLVNRLDRERFWPMVICLEHSGGAADWITREGVPVVQLHKPPGNSLRIVRQLADVLREHRIDLVHSHNWGTLVESVLACRRVKGIRHVHAEHGLELDEFRVRGWKRHLRRLAMGWAMRRTDAVVAIARCVQHWIETECRVPSEMIHYIPNGVEAPEPVPASSRVEIRARLGLNADAFLFGSVGRLVPLKDFGVAIRAVAKLLEDGANAHLVIVGDGPERPRLVAEVQAAGAAGHVHVVGHQLNLGEWLLAFDAYVNSSRTEAMNMGILEAMAAGLPIIATDVGDAAVLVDGHSPAGWLVPPGNATALAESMANLVADPKAARSLAENSRRRYESAYQTGQMIERYAELYTKLFVKNRSPRTGRG